MAFWGKSFQDVGNIFKSSWGKSWDDFYNSFDGFDKKLDVTGGKIKAFGGAIGNGLKGVFTKTKDSPLELMADEDASKFIEDFAKATDGGAESIQKFNISLEDPSMKAYLKTVDAGGASLKGYTKFVNESNTALKATSLSSKAAAVGMKALSIAGNMLVGIGIGLGIDLLVKGLDYLVHANEKAIEKANELRSAYEQFTKTNSDNIKTLGSLKVEFEELSKGVDKYGKNISLTADQYERYKEILQQILNISPSLAEGYTTENGLIADKNGLIERAIELQEIESRNELRKITNLENLKTSLKGYLGAYKQALGSQNGQVYDGEILGGIEYSNVKNSIWEAFNVNGRENYSDADLGKEILESLGVKDAENEIQQYLNEYDSSLTGKFWEDYMGKILQNVDTIVGKLDASGFENVGLDEKTFDTNLENLKEAVTIYSDIVSASKAAQQSIQADLQNVAQYNDSYKDLSSEQAIILDTWMKQFTLDDVVSEKLGFQYIDEDKIANLKNQVNDFVKLLSENDTAKQAINDFFALDKTALSVSDWQSQANSLVDSVANALKLSDDEKLQLKVGLGLVYVNEQGYEVNSTDDLAFEAAKKFKGNNLVSEKMLGEMFTEEELKFIINFDGSFNPKTDLVKQVKAAMAKVDTPSLPFDLEAPRKEINEFISEIDKLNSAYGSLQNGEDLSLGSITELIQKYPEFAEQLSNINSNHEVGLSLIESIFDREKALSIQKQANHLLSLSNQADELENLRQLYLATGDLAKMETVLESIRNNKTSTAELAANLSILSDLEPEYDSKSNKSDNTDQYLENWNKLIAEKEHLRKMDKLTNQDYFDWLDVAYKEHFGGREKYLSEFQKYEEEVFEGRKQLVTDEISLLNEQKSKIEEVYSETTDALKKSQEAIKKAYDERIRLIDDEIKKKTDANKESQLEFDIAKKKQAFEDAQKSKVNRVYIKGSGIIYRPDDEDISSKKKDYEAALLEKELFTLNKDKENLETDRDSKVAEIDKNVESIDSELKKITDSIENTTGTLEDKSNPIKENNPNVYNNLNIPPVSIEGIPEKIQLNKLSSGEILALMENVVIRSNLQGNFNRISQQMGQQLLPNFTNNLEKNNNYSNSKYEINIGDIIVDGGNDSYNVAEAISNNLENAMKQRLFPNH